MKADEAFDLFNRLMLAKTQTGLSKQEQDLFIGIWEGKTYPQIAKECHRSEQTIKQNHSQKLFGRVKQLWGVDVKKDNFKPTVETLLQQHLAAKENLVPQQAVTPVDILQLTNPFFPLTGKIDDRQLFFNRDKEKRETFEKLNNGTSVALIGESEIGKSSLLWAIEQEAEKKLKPPRKPIPLDLQSISDEDDFYEALCEKINIKKVRGYRLTRSLENLGIPLLLLLDEVEKIKGDDFAEVCDRLGSLAGSGSNPLLRLVVAARSPLNDLFPDISGKTSPFYKHFTNVEVAHWNEETMRGFIASRLNSPLLKPGAKSVSFTEEEIALVMAESGGHPQKLMQLCYEIYKNYLEE